MATSTHTHLKYKIRAISTNLIQPAREGENRNRNKVPRRLG
ncbi:uncharacterized protein G2W53_035023 [Senna tora]|uniref:Uncharacterized protein n=1 Tax=Senna tora TaxID=362788 RepID=A0A834W3Q8_9FABA|nr:uncharacterized protein G2W53_035023 [Senna tora]